MRLQQKIYKFEIESGDKPMSRLLTSNVVIDNKLTSLLIADLFYSKYSESGNTIRGYSPILENIDANNNVSINDIVYNVQFTGDKDNFILRSVTDPTNYTMNDKQLSDDECLHYEKLIQESTPTKSTEQPQEAKTERETEPVGVTLFKSADYELEKENNPEFTEYNTSPVSNMKLLVNESELPETEDDIEEKLVLIEIEKNESFAILIRTEYKIELNQNEKTFTYEKISG